MSRLKQINTALAMYVQDYDDRLPPHATVYSEGLVTPLPYLIQPYLVIRSTWACPSDRPERSEREQGLDGSERDTDTSYGYNWHALSPGGRGVRIAAVQKPNATVAFIDSFSYLATPGPAGGTGLAARHSGGVNVAWLDGYVKFAPQPDVITAQAASEDGKPLKPGIDSYPLWNLR